jgi:hypothetical protein
MVVSFAYWGRLRRKGSGADAAGGGSLVFTGGAGGSADGFTVGAGGARGAFVLGKLGGGAAS